MDPEAVIFSLVRIVFAAEDGPNGPVFNQLPFLLFWDADFRLKNFLPSFHFRVTFLDNYIWPDAYTVLLGNG